FQFNVQELATLKQNKLPIKLFVLDNEGYLLIRHTQKTHLGGRLMGESPQTGLYCPNAAKVADAYGIASLQVSKTSELKSKLANALKLNGPVVCNIKSPKWQTIGPRVSSERRPDGSFVSHPFEDMFPFLPRDEFKKNMAGE
ncbi:thiamine pyrophosphate-binding protein, partial [Candidatus Curtissbacteria bacterium]|nr:thiamine pyrophosphate-binding protein [Candidatus Curtissbacteria bacterium]